MPAPASTKQSDRAFACITADKMWPYITEAVNKEAAVQLPPLIKASKPTWMGDITLHKCAMAIAGTTFVF